MLLSFCSRVSQEPYILKQTVSLDSVRWPPIKSHSVRTFSKICLATNYTAIIDFSLFYFQKLYLYISLVKPKQNQIKRQKKIKNKQHICCYFTYLREYIAVLIRLPLMFVLFSNIFSYSLSLFLFRL